MLHFDIEEQGLAEIISELNATPLHVKYALNRAKNRTATSLRTMAARGLRSELELRTISLLRRRLKTLRIRTTDGNSLGLWFGLNSMPVSWFKGRPQKTKSGASFRGVEFSGAFVAKSKIKGRMTIFKRTGKERLHIVEQEMPIADKAQIYIEDEIFVKTEQIFWKFFERDLRARVKYNLGLQS